MRVGVCLRVKHIRLIGVLFIVGAIGALVLTICCISEPRFEDRTLSNWITEGFPAYYPMEGYSSEAFDEVEARPLWKTTSRAVKQMSPDAIPCLLSWLRAKDSPGLVKIGAWANQHLSTRWKVRSARESKITAIIGFGFLADAAKPAWPVLCRSAADTNCAYRHEALLCLLASRADRETLLPLVLVLRSDSDQGIQRTAREILQDQFPRDMAAAGVPGDSRCSNQSATGQMSVDQAQPK